MLAFLGMEALRSFNLDSVMTSFLGVLDRKQLVERDRDMASTIKRAVDTS